MTDRNYIDTKDAAAMLRVALRQAFPGTKFGVRISRYSGGSSIRVEWTDGPTAARVREVSEVYGGRGFDGMTDSSTYHDVALLSDGSVAWLPEGDLPAGARRIHFSCFAPSLNRDVSKELEARAVELIVATGKADAASFAASAVTRRYPLRAYRDDDGNPALSIDSHNGSYGNQLVWSLCAMMDGR